MQSKKHYIAKILPFKFILFCSLFNFEKVSLNLVLKKSLSCIYHVFNFIENIDEFSLFFLCLKNFYLGLAIIDFESV